MARFLYACLVQMHPRHFRQRYGEEMLWVYEQAARDCSAGSLLADAVLSLARQWVLRSGDSGAPAAQTVPLLCASGNERPRTGALLHGMVLSLAIFTGLTFAMHYGGNPPLHLALPGRAFSSPVPVRPQPASVFAALDTDGDGVLSASEIASAPALLATLDNNGDGKLSADECGDRVPPALDTDHDGELSASEIRNAPAALAALDTNHDGRLTPAEWATQQ